MTPLPITVIIPCYNMALLLARAVESALRAGADHVIVTNDGSTDNTHVICERLRAEVGITYIRSSMRNGVCFARNQAIAQASANTLIVPLDADDWIPADGANGLGILFQAYRPRTWVYGDWAESIDGAVPVPVTAPPAGMLNRKNICHATMIFAKEDWERVGGYDPEFNIGGEDWAFQRALTQAGVTPVKTDGVTYCRTVGDNERTNKARDRIPFINQLMREKYGG